AGCEALPIRGDNTPAYEVGRTIPNRPSAPAATPPPQSRITSSSIPLARPGSIAADPDDEAADYAPPAATVPGYRIERELGRGGMGAVFLARQLSLDRPVALKVMARRFAADPQFVARFTREAFAAAQLSHPNIVHIHDIGEAEGARFFSMEYVPGRSLADLLAERGKLDPETAVGLVLQAARGLKHAHDRGMVHRDVKPDNLLIDDQGLVKVADLGLVKVRGAEPAVARSHPAPHTGSGAQRADLTGVRIALGTPAYMSPEQCRDATTVDHRADIYSLGCTLYVLVTGRPPFDGTTAVEVMSKHAYDPIVPPERIVARVPAELSSVILRMMAKEAADRFADMGELIRTLEDWLGVRSSAGGFVPREEQIAKLEGFAHAFATAPAAVLRGRLVLGLVAGVTALAALLLFFGKLTWASALLGMLPQFGLAYFVLNGLSARGPVFSRVRQFVFGLGWADLGIAAAGFALFLLLLGMSGVFWHWAGAGAVAVGLALGLRRWLDRKADEQRAGPLRGCERLLRQLRAQGLDEDEVRLFVARFAGRHWEEFFEAMFGYEGKLAARPVLLRGGAAGRREKYAAWREPVLALIDRAERARKEARERRLLQAVEQSRLQAEGLARAEAERKAAAAAEALVQEAARFRRAPVGSAAGVQALVSGASHPEFEFAPTPPDPIGRVVGLFVGAPIRTALASALIAGCGLWAHQNGLLPGMETGRRAAAAIEAQDMGTLEQVATETATRVAVAPLHVEDVPAWMTGWADSWNVGLAGLLLLGSLCFRGNLMAVLVLTGAGLVVGGHHLGIRTVEPLHQSHVGLLLGTVVAFVGFRTGTR
ncbi:MAG TPA: serine/threonine-protein kinase, partial [Urbifossiella sp.]|nr:serine/threonine-protein kinase [Urbifossiella sp.]